MVLHSKKLSAIVGKLKDKATIFSSAAASTTSTSLSPNFVVLNLTAHQPATSPPNPSHVSAFLSFGQGSRLLASSAITPLVSRLSSTHNPTVALKCLLVFHHVVRSGSFILQDQLVCFLRPKFFGGHNHLNLSGFRHGSWAKSTWVRWYARFLEHVISSYKIVGNFNFVTKDNSKRSALEEVEKVSGLLNVDLLREVEALVGLMEEIVKVPEEYHLHHRQVLDHEQRNRNPNRLVGEVVRLVEDDRVALEDSISIRIREIKERIEGIGFGDSVELICLLRRLEEIIIPIKSNGDGCWSDSKRELKKFGGSGVGGFRKLVEEVKMMVSAVIVEKEEKGRAKVRREKGSESARLVGYDQVRLGSTEEVKMMVSAVIVEKEEKGRAKVRREKGSESARLVGYDQVRLGSVEPVRFGSTRWYQR